MMSLFSVFCFTVAFLLYSLKSFNLETRLNMNNYLFAVSTTSHGSRPALGRGRRRAAPRTARGCLAAPAWRWPTARRPNSTQGRCGVHVGAARRAHSASLSVGLGVVGCGMHMLDPQRLSQRADVNWLPPSDVMTAGMPYLAIQPLIKTEAHDLAEISHRGRLRTT
jgi:hypothetical protein